MQVSKNISMRDYTRIFFKHKFLIAALVAVTMVTVHIGLAMRTPMHTARVQMIISGTKKTEADYYRGVIAGSIVSGHSQLVRSTNVIARVVEALGLYKRPLDYELKYASGIKKFFINYEFGDQIREFNQLPEKERTRALFQNAMGQLDANIDVESSPDSPIFNISVTDYNPNEAIRIANSLSRSYVIYDLEQQAAEYELEFGGKNSKVIQILQYIEDFKKHLDGKLLPNIEAMGPASIKIVEQARGTTQVIYKPSNSVARLLSFIMSLSLGFLVAFALEFLNQSIQSPQDIESLPGLACLGSIPKAGSKRELLVNYVNPKNTKYLKTYQSLSNQIYIMMNQQGKNIALVTDAEGSPDTSYVVANLGISLSGDEGHKVIIIDANMKSPSIHKVFDIPNDNGVSEILEGTVEFESVITEVRPNLYVIPAGRSKMNPSTFLGASLMGDIMKKAGSMVDFVIVIGANVKESSDAVLLSTHADGLILVINEGQVKRHIVQRALAAFEQKKIAIIGAIINNRRHVIPEVIYKRT
ncbi:MAG: hypothetical protein AB1499_10215 [Nitrospirota bacterium]